MTSVGTEGGACPDDTADRPSPRSSRDPGEDLMSRAALDAIFAPPSQGEGLWHLGVLWTLKVPAAATGGAFSLAEQLLPKAARSRQPASRDARARNRIPRSAAGSAALTGQSPVSRSGPSRGGYRQDSVGHDLPQDPHSPASNSPASPCSMAYLTSSTRLCSCSLPSVFCTWFCTVRWDRTSLLAICL